MSLLIHILYRHLKHSYDTMMVISVKIHMNSTSDVALKYTCLYPVFPWLSYDPTNKEKHIYLRNYTRDKNFDENIVSMFTMSQSRLTRLSEHTTRILDPFNQSSFSLPIISKLDEYIFKKSCSQTLFLSSRARSDEFASLFSNAKDEKKK